VCEIPIEEKTFLINLVLIAPVFSEKNKSPILTPLGLLFTSWVRAQDIIGRGSNYHEWGSIYQKRNKRPKGVKIGDLFFSENTGAIRTKFIRNVINKNRQHTFCLHL
jgi:hypothetical protein